MHLHVLGICGTFMGGLALIARALGHKVSGSDENVYPPMSTLLAEHDIQIQNGFEKTHLVPAPDLVVVGNAMSRGRPVVEYMLDAGLPYISGPQWLSENLLRDRSVIAVAGTHGKTTTASMIAWILDKAGARPGYLIGGVPAGLGVSARVGESPWFVVEADEYDTAFFDKRSKFVHYQPNIAVLNNLEFDHADIFDDVAAIKRQFHHLVRIVPSSGLIVANARDRHIADVLEQGCWTPVEYFQSNVGVDTSAAESIATETMPTENATKATLLHADGSRFRIECAGEQAAEISWDLIGDHNVANGLAATLAARAVGVQLPTIAAALDEFKPSRRRLECVVDCAGITVYDDFAHHPTAVRTTLTALRLRASDKRLVAVIEIRSNSMRMGVHRDALTDALRLADLAFVYTAPTDVKSAEHEELGEPDIHRFDDFQALLVALESALRQNDQIVIMSNGSFNGLAVELKQRILKLGDGLAT